MSRKHFSLRVTLTMFTTTLIVLLSASIFAISYLGSAKSVLILSNSMSDQISKGIITEMNSLLNGAEKVSAEIGFFIRNGMVDGRDLKDGRLAMDLAAQYIGDYPSFTSVDIGFPNGNKFKAERMGDGSVSRRSYLRDAKGVAMTWYHSNPDNAKDFKDKFQDLAKGYDPRTRPWWIAATNAGSTVWTDVYVSGTRKQFVYSCAMPVYDEGHKLLAVSSIDINVVTLSQFLGSLDISHGGRAFIVNDKNQVIAVPMKSEGDLDKLVKKAAEGSDNPFEFYTLNELPDLSVKNALTAWIAGTGASASFEYKAEGTDYIATMVKYPYKPGTVFTIGVIMPQKEVMADINRNSLFVVLGILAFLATALLVGFFGSRALARSLAQLAGEVDKVSKLDLGSEIAISTSILEVHEIDEAVGRMKKGLSSFKKYVPAELVLQLNSMQKEATLEGEKRELTIFFSDITDFTAISERLGAEKLVENLGVYFDAMSRTILDNDGTVDKYIGDAIMAFWGAPIRRSNHAALACRAAVKCQAALDLVAEAWTKNRQPIFETRIGLHTGEVIVGNFGYSERMNYTILGDNVNLASRLEGLNKHYGTRVLISDPTLFAAGAGFVTRKIDLVAVKGRSKGVLIHELIGLENEVPAERLVSAELYNQGFDAYLARDWKRAMQAFAEVQARSKAGDPASAIMVERCQALAADSRLPDDWNGVYHFSMK